MTRIHAAPLTAEGFAPFGDVIDAATPPDVMINDGLCARHHDLARMDFGTGRAGISVFSAEARPYPLRVDMMERHPLGSQAFLPLSGAVMVVVVAPDACGVPGDPRAFVTAPGQGINLLRDTWHGVLAPLAAGQFAVVDRIGAGDNLVEHRFDVPYVVHPPR